MDLLVRSKLSFGLYALLKPSLMEKLVSCVLVRSTSLCSMVCIWMLGCFEDAWFNIYHPPYSGNATGDITLATFLLDVLPFVVVVFCICVHILQKSSVEYFQFWWLLELIRLCQNILRWRLTFLNTNSHSKEMATLKDMSHTRRIGMCIVWVFNYIKLLVELHLLRLIATFNPATRCNFSQHGRPFCA